MSVYFVLWFAWEDIYLRKSPITGSTLAADLREKIHDNHIDAEKTPLGKTLYNQLRGNHSAAASPRYNLPAAPSGLVVRAKLFNAGNLCRDDTSKRSSMIEVIDSMKDLYHI